MKVVDQERGHDGWIFANFFFCVFMDRNGVQVHKLAKKERGQYPAILTEHNWSIKDYYMAFGVIFLAGHSGHSRASKIAPSCPPARVANHSAGFCSSFPLTELAIIPKMVLTFKCVDETPVYDHSNESYWETLHLILCTCMWHCASCCTRCF